MVFPAGGVASVDRHVFGDSGVVNKGAGAVEVVLLAANPAPFVEAPVEVLGGLELVVGVGDEPGAVALCVKQFRHRVQVLLDGSPAGRAPEVSLLVLVAVEGIDALAGVQGAANGEGGQRFGIGAGEED